MSQKKSPKPTPPAWWRGGVIYQIYPRSFADSNGDGVGDLPGITARLPYVAGLGVDAIWISPFFTSPMKDFGYDVADYRDVDPLFGSLADFDALVARAHALGLKVMIDQVLSHCSDQHPWFQASQRARHGKHADWFVWADPKPDGNPPNNWLSVFGGSAWQWHAGRRQYYLHNFLASQPDLNFHAPAVRKQLLSDIEFWLQRGVDGFRFDACNFHFHDPQLRSNPPARVPDTSVVKDTNPYGMQAHKYDKTRPENIAFLQQVRKLLDRYGAASVGEVGADDSLGTMADYTRGGDRLHMAYSFNLLTKDKSAAHVRQQVQDLEARIGDGWACWSLGNHDVERMLSRWGGAAVAADSSLAQAFAQQHLALLGCLRGSLCWYQGDELALPEAEVPYALLQDPYGKTFWPEFKGRDGCRTPMPWASAKPHAGFSGARKTQPWLPVPQAHAQRALDVAEANPGAALHAIRRFLAWRKTQTVLWSGSIEFLDAKEPVLALLRRPLQRGQAGGVLAVFNLSAKPVSVRVAEAPDSTVLAGHGLDAALLGTRRGAQFALPAYGLYLGTLSEGVSPGFSPAAGRPARPAA